MPFNLLKKYPELLEIMSLSENDRKVSLRRIFKRDIEDNDNFKFRNKQIRPIKIDGQIPMETLFEHLTTERIEITDESGRKFNKPIFERDRSERLHWIKYHIEENKTHKFIVFSCIERNPKLRKNVTNTYLYDIEQKYIIVLEVQKSGIDYYLVSAHYLNKKWGEKNIKNKLKKKLNDVV